MVDEAEVFVGCIGTGGLDSLGLNYNICLWNNSNFKCFYNYVLCDALVCLWKGVCVFLLAYCYPSASTSVIIYSRK